MNLVVNTDGASRGNPGPASYGFVIKSEDGVILHQEGKTLGEKTNNFAEYSAVIGALEYIKKHYAHKAPHTIKLLADSELLVRQLSGIYKVKHPIIKQLYERVRALEDEVGAISYNHIPRAQNFIADRLANNALDSD